MREKEANLDDFTSGVYMVCICLFHLWADAPWVSSPLWQTTEAFKAHLPGERNRLAKLRHKEAIEAFMICLTVDMCFLQASRWATCRRYEIWQSSGSHRGPGPLCLRLVTRNGGRIKVVGA